MGEALYAQLSEDRPTLAYRTYAPVGSHRDLLAYLVRRLLENGANSSFVALAADDKGVIYEGAFGKRNLVTGAAMTPDTMFWIASMTKAVTSTAAMQMVEQGKLSLDKPMSDVVLELSAAQVLEGFDASGAPKLRPPKRGIC